MTANAKRNRLEETATKTPEKVSIPLYLFRLITNDLHKLKVKVTPKSYTIFTDVH